MMQMKITVKTETPILYDYEQIVNGIILPWARKERVSKMMNTTTVIRM